jgi:hypothetical protein
MLQQNIRMKLQVAPLQSRPVAIMFLGHFMIVPVADSPGKGGGIGGRLLFVNHLVHLQDLWWPFISSASFSIMYSRSQEILLMRSEMVRQFLPAQLTPTMK